jgi:hypothetical protein
MSLAETVLQKVADHLPRNDRHDLTLTEAGWSITVALERADDLGCLIREMSLSRTAPAPATDSLRAWADRIVKNATGLLEPLKVVEIDDVSGKALLRSSPPSLRKSKRSYYEVLLQGTQSASFRRFQADEDDNGKRMQVAFALTHEALGKLIEALTTA